VHSAHNFSSHSEQYFSACTVLLLSKHETVIPLDFASKDVKKSSLLFDTLREIDNMTETLQKIADNRDDNRKLLKRKKSLIIKQIRAVKSKPLKQFDDLKEKVITEVASVGYQEYKLYSIQHHVEYRNNQSGRLCVCHSLF
jgi:hypothetical protein